MKSEYRRRIAGDRAWALVGIASLVVSGCFSGEYGRRMDQTITNLNSQSERAAAVFASASDVMDGAGAETGVSLRLPIFVDSDSKSLRAEAANAQPPFFQLPGLAYAYEIPLDGVPGFVYFAAVKSDQKAADALAQEVQAGVAKTFSGAAWQDATIDKFSGGSMTVKRLTASGPQAFGSEKTDGRFELYLISSSGYHVLIGWRAPAGAGGFFEKVAISMSTLEGAA